LYDPSASCVQCMLVYRYDRVAGAVELISKGSAGQPAYAFYDRLAISGDGRVVGFRSNSLLLVPGVSPVPGTPGGTLKMFFWDAPSGAFDVMTCQSGSCGGQDSELDLSEDGSVAVYGDWGPTAGLPTPNPAGGDNGTQSFVYQRSCDRQTMVSGPLSGERPNGQTRRHRISADGTTVVFDSTAANLVAGFTPGYSSVYSAPIVPCSREYLSKSPSRLLDTRAGGVTVDGRFMATGQLPAGRRLEVLIAGRRGIPHDATSVALTVTVTGAAGQGFVTVWPCDTANPPNSSNLNFVAGQDVPNLVVVALSSRGTVCVQPSEAATHLIADLAGVFPSSSSYRPRTPARLLDTRLGTSTVDGQAVGIGRRSAGTRYELTVAGRAGVPSDVEAVVLNVTATATDRSGFLSVWPCDTPNPPDASTLNFAADHDIPGLVVVQVSPSGTVCLQSTSGGTHLIADLEGWFPAGSPYTAVRPARLFDTRPSGSTIDGQGAGRWQFKQGETLAIQITGRAGIPASGVRAAVLNFTATSVDGAGFITVWPCRATPMTSIVGGPVFADPGLPNSSNVNFVPGIDVANAVITALGPTGQICVRAPQGSAHVLADLAGWFPAD
jgi:hypothetical protein